MRKARGPTKRQAALLKQVTAKGGIGRFRESDGLFHFRFFDGSAAHATTVTSCIRAGFLLSNNDGLFPGCTQTWRRA